eukprot:TRINITY_DN9045_c0_g1_i1.p1 TRINITY_DN9045_c0_g1~~TRINITY_DN9045_c0_g1_i1.p1  ORF type:complete len:393 (+),score=100.61 TRINITY_DN9045_c0_g1_i1:63-1241(+)
MSGKEETKELGFETRQIHAGSSPDPVTGAILPPIYMSTTFVQESVDKYMEKGYSYSRASNPTVRALEKKIADLECGYDACCFATGMAATTSLMLALTSAGDHVILSDVAYGGTYRLQSRIMVRFGVETSFVDTSDPEKVRAAIRPNTKVLFTESPANPTLKLTDIAAVSDVVRPHGIVHAVDNTFLTPYFQQPLKLGADIVVQSTTKYFDGHNATVGGAVISATKELHEKVKFIQKACGTIMSADVAFTQFQGTKTLSLRILKQSENAMKVAQFLEQHEKVERVCYPGLPSFPQYELACKQQKGFGAMIWFEVKGGLEAGKKLMSSVKVWTLAENLGAVESLITHPPTMTHSDMPAEERNRVGITDGLVRLSTGAEDVQDLIEDLRQALAQL